MLENRQKIESSVIGSIANDILVLDDYDITINDFITNDGVYYISLFRHVRESGVSVLDDASIQGCLNDEMLKIYNSKKGWKKIESLKRHFNKDNFTGYYDALCRENTILALHDNGFNLLKPIYEGGKEIIPLNLFRKMPSADVIEWYEAKLNEFNKGAYDSNVIEEEMIDIDDEFINDVAQGAAAGVPFDIISNGSIYPKVKAFEGISNQINGYMEGTFNILAGHSSVGKTSMYLQIILALIYRGKKVLIISNEQAIKYFKMLLMIFVISEIFGYKSLTRSKATAGRISSEDMEVIGMARDWLKNNVYGSLKIIRITDANMSVVKRKIRENVLRYGFDVFLYDTFKLDMSDNGNTDEKAYLSMIRDSRVLAQLAAKYNVIGLASVQLALASLGRLWLDSSCLSTAKAIKEIAETLFLVRNVYPEELDKASKKYIHPFIKDADGKFVECIDQLDKDANYKVLFIDKNRNGQDVANGIAYLLKFDGAHGVFQEVCMCKPKHGRID